MPYTNCLEHVGNMTAVHCLPLYVSHKEHPLPFPGLLQYVGGISHLDLEAVSEVGHEGMVLLSALVRAGLPKMCLNSVMALLV